MSADLRRFMFVAPLLLAFSGCEWFSDFKDQPKIDPWEPEYAGTDTVPFRGNPQFSVPLQSGGVAGFIVSHEPTPVALDSLAPTPNPTPMSAQSLEIGRKYYQINCTVCHGPAGAGNGPALQYFVPAPSLLTPVTVDRTDGYLYGIIRNGRGMMSNYARIPDANRWDVVNYIRALQGRGGMAADTTPAGWPGQNGRHVPGYSDHGPTRPSPYGIAGVAVSPEARAAGIGPVPLDQAGQVVPTAALRRMTQRPGAPSAGADTVSGQQPAAPDAPADTTRQAAPNGGSR